ncbi:MAG: aminopeptidase [Candidatus Sericytochromatia bacterium]|nr:aminopeptidase [Candidatus Sericytochromatia bacterium]
MKNSLKIFLSSIVLLQLNSCYFVNQGFNLFKYNLSAKPLDEIYKNPKISQKVKDKIKIIYDIREFATKNIGLKMNKTYTKYVQLKGRDYLTNVVVGSKSDKLEAYQWGFPFFGSFPYKGFYNYGEARDEELRLKSLGYDTYIRTAGAFSTLGWFDDPIYSYMLNYPTEYLANLVIHEMTHATVFIKDNIQFNEEMASFVGEQGGIDFLKSKYGENSKEYKLSFDLKDDDKIFSVYVNEFYNSLKNLYSDNSKNKEDKLVLKQKIIDSYRFEKFRELQKKFKTPGAYAWFPKLHLNNAVIMGFITYQQDASLYRQVYNKQGHDLTKTVEFFKYLQSQDPKDPKQFLKNYLNDVK